MSLHALRILDTTPERRFDRITRMAKKLFDVEICLISLVAATRQWFKSKQGLDACETSREISFCGHAILDDDIFIIEDATLDPRFDDNPLVTGPPNIRFYAGCPVRSPQGHRVGTLCLIDPNPRIFSADEQVTLRDLAAMVEDEFELLSQSTVDDLTQVSNRRGFNKVTEHLLSLCRRLGTPAEVIFFDLDDFKTVNDTLGHEIGDKMLQSFAKLLTKCFRSADVVARLGGDEFAVFAAATDHSSDAALQRLQKMTDEANDELEGKLAWSAGRVAIDPDRHLTIESVLSDADSRMYEDKTRRRLQRS